MQKVEAILHPVRFRIIQSFLGGESKTAKQLVKQLKDISQATLYRQLDILVKAEVLIITEENPIRGTVEKVYSLNASKTILNNQDIKELSKEEHLQYFLLFTAQLAKNFEAYLQNDDIDFERDGVGYRQVGINLSDQEFIALVKELSAVLKKYVAKPSTPDRTKRIISTITIPEKERGNGDV